MTAENIDPLYLKRHPEQFKEMTYGLAKEISARVMKQDMKPCVKRLLDEVVNANLENIIRKHTDEIWLECDIENNVADLIKIAEATDSEDPAWRPKTGVVNTDAIEANVLKCKKAQLKKMIETNEKYIEDLEATITHKRTELDEQMAKLIKTMNEF